MTTQPETTSQPTRPARVAVQPETIPADLRAAPHWVTWQWIFQADRGKWTKPPYQAGDGRNAKTNDPATWSPFDAALADVQSGRRDRDGVGFVFTDTPLTGIDLDHCLAADGTPSAWAQALVDSLNSYTEITPSGDGLHILVKGTLPPGRRQFPKGNGAKLELYDQESPRYFTVTGQHFPGTPVTIEARQAELAALHAQEMATFKAQAQARKPAAGAPVMPLEDDDELLERARAARDGGKFTALFDLGDLTAYGGDASRGDLALCALLAFWTGRDAPRMDRLFRLSALFREKWDMAHAADGQTYGELTIGAALAGNQTVYTGRGATAIQGNDATPEIPGAPAATPETTGETWIGATDHEGHAQAVLKRYQGRIAWNAAFGWLWYNGTHWERLGAEEQITRAIVDTLKARAMLAVQAQLPLTKFSCDSGRITGILKLLQSLTYVGAGEFDAAPDLLNVANGVLNLRDLSLQPHAPEWRFTYCLKTPYDRDALQRPEYADLMAILDNLTPDREYLKLAGGYSLTGDTHEEVLFYLLGPARAGKGSITEALLTLLPYPLSTEAGFETFATERQEGQNFDIAPLRPCRAVFASESERRQQLNAARIKRITGGNFITAAFKYGDAFTFRPCFKLWLSSNFPPSVDTDDDAAWGRVKIIAFPTSHLGNEDLTIKAGLKQPEYQICLLHWLADGAALWYAHGLPRAQDGGIGTKIAQQTQIERDAQDTIAQFAQERLSRFYQGALPGEMPKPLPLGDNAHRLTSAEVYTAYEQWCKDNGVKARYVNQFIRALRAKGYDYKREKDFRGFVGVRLV